MHSTRCQIGTPVLNTSCNINFEQSPIFFLEVRYMITGEMVYPVESVSEFESGMSHSYQSKLSKNGSCFWRIRSFFGADTPFFSRIFLLQGYFCPT